MDDANRALGPASSSIGPVPSPSRPRDKQADAAPNNTESRGAALTTSLEGRSFGTRN
jgi:hypothetical protein